MFKLRKIITWIIVISLILFGVISFYEQYRIESKNCEHYKNAEKKIVQSDLCEHETITYLKTWAKQNAPNCDGSLKIMKKNRMKMVFENTIEYYYINYLKYFVDRIQGMWLTMEISISIAVISIVLFLCFACFTRGPFGILNLLMSCFKRSIVSKVKQENTQDWDIEAVDK